jgi:hypothetical protein
VGQEPTQGKDPRVIPASHLRVLQPDAVNCVVRRGDKLIGANNDGKGFLEALRPLIDPAASASSCSAPVAPHRHWLSPPGRTPNRSCPPDHLDGVTGM